jgi:hypothetical protein
MGLFEKAKSVLVRERGQALVSKSSRTTSSIITSDDNFDQRVETLKKIRRSYERIPLVRSIIDTKVDQTVQHFYFEGPKKKVMEKWSDTVNLPLLFQKIDKSRRLYGDTFIEVVTKNDLKILNPIWIRVYTEPTGDVIGYSQIIENEKKVLWGTTGSPKEDEAYPVKAKTKILHFKHNTLGSEKYGKSDIEPLLPLLQVKANMEEDVGHIVKKYIAPLIWAKVGNDQMPANENIVSQISDDLRDIQAESEITTSHLVDLSVLDFQNKGMDIKTPLAHIDQNLITGGHVPPVLLGRSDGTDSAQAEVQLRNFGRHIKAGQRELKYDFEDLIIVGLGLATRETKLQWGHVEEREWETEVDIIRGLVKDGVLTPQKANDLLPPRFNENLGEDGKVIAIARQGQQSPDKEQDNPNDPTQTTKNDKSMGRRIGKQDKFDKRDNK